MWGPNHQLFRPSGHTAYYLDLDLDLELFRLSGHTAATLPFLSLIHRVFTLNLILILNLNVKLIMTLDVILRDLRPPRRRLLASLNAFLASMRWLPLLPLPLLTLLTLHSDGHYCKSLTL